MGNDSNRVITLFHFVYSVFQLVGNENLVICSLYSTFGFINGTEYSLNSSIFTPYSIRFVDYEMAFYIKTLQFFFQTMHSLVQLVPNNLRCYSADE